MSNSRYPYSQWFQQLGYIHSRSLSLHIRISCHYNFLHPTVLHSGQQFLNTEIIRANPLQRRQRSMKHMIYTLEISHSFHSIHILWLFHHTNLTVVPPSCLTNTARIFIAKIKANMAIANLFLGINNSCCQLPGFGRLHIQHMISQSYRSLIANPRQCLKMLY